MIQIEKLHKTYHRGTESIEAINGIDLQISRGSFVVILGPSGGGKSTLLNLIGGIDRPTSGSVRISDFALETASEEKLTLFRRDHIGFIFQFYNLLPALSAVENVSVPLLVKGMAFKQAKETAAKILEKVGLQNRIDHRPSQLSGGEQQRVAIARSIIAEPELILADEPTGDLDSKTALDISQLMHELNKQLGLTFVVATHNPRLTDYADQVYELIDGKLNTKSNEKDQ
jgi:putative ABC transport system ATP-binding protein